LTRGPGYKWVALSNTLLAVILVTIDASIVLIAMPEIFRGIHLDPLQPGNSFYLLWLMLGFLIVTSVLVVGLGRLGDIFGRVRMYNLGFVVFTAGSIMLAVDWLDGRSGALFLIVFRIVQGFGGAMLLANSTAILTDAFPENQRGLALGINNIVGIAGQFIGLVVGGILAPVDWRLIFIVPVPFAVFGTIWSYLKLEELGIRKRAPIDWIGNLTFAAGLILFMVGVTYGIQPSGSSAMGWQSPLVLTLTSTGLVLLVAFVLWEIRVAHPMFELSLLRIRPFAAGILAAFLSALARGGLLFVLIIWLQGIWLPRHGYSFASTPLWAGIYLLPLSLGFLLVGPTSGHLSDRFGARGFATLGMLGSALSFGLLALLPIDFSYIWLALILFCLGSSMGLFASPNRASVMNSLPPEHRGAGAGLATTTQNSAQVLSIGLFFTLMILGLSSTLPGSLERDLSAHHLPQATVDKVAHAPPVSVLFSAFLGYNPVEALAGPKALDGLPAADRQALTGRTFFPALISGPFRRGLHAAIGFAILACLIAALASWLRGPPPAHVRRRSLEPESATVSPTQI